MFALVDCNNFYVSCERVFNPALEGKKVVILSNNDGCIIARSEEVKPFVPMGAPVHQYLKTLQAQNVQVYSANFSLYGDMSRRVMGTLKRFTTKCEIYSVDEAFLQLEQTTQLKTQLSQVQQCVKQWTGIPVSIGAAPTKALAKVANKIAKKFVPRTQGVYLIDSEEKRVKALRWMDIGVVWGVGRNLARKLKELGVYDAYAFTQLSDAFVRKRFSIVMLRLKYELMGNSVMNIETLHHKKSIAVTRSFEGTQKHYAYLEERITTFTVKASEKLRRQQSLCCTLYIFIRTNRFNISQKQYARSRHVSLPFATDSSIVLVKAAKRLLKSIFLEGYAYKKAGVILMDLLP
ncbi:MAG: Y-family DNA polymerase, partial [Bacteroidota bacterium]